MVQYTRIEFTIVHCSNIPTHYCVIESYNTYILQQEFNKANQITKRENTVCLLNKLYCNIS